MSMPARSFSMLLLALIVQFSLQPAAFAQEQDPQDVLEQLQQQYQEIETLQASFTQTTRMPQGADAPVTNSGTLTLRGESYRVELPDQTIVADGETTWIYMHAEEQVLINDYEEEETTFSPTNFFLQFDERYAPREAEADEHEGEDYLRLLLESEDPATMFTEITVWIHEESQMVRRIDVVDVNETEITFELDDVELNPTVDEDVFVFSPPEDVEVIDLRI